MMNTRQKGIAVSMVLLALEGLAVFTPSIPFPVISKLSIGQLALGALGGGFWYPERVLLVGAIAVFPIGFALALFGRPPAARLGIWIQLVSLTALIGVFARLFAVANSGLV